MNILFITYGDSSSNSLNHVTSFSDNLVQLGHDCRVITQSNSKQTAPPIQSAVSFANGSTPDVIHAWTPRITVLEKLIKYQRQLTTPARVVVHMEDNERHLLSHTASTAFDQLSLWADRKLKPLIKKGLAHPVRHQLLLAASDLVTGIVPKLSEHTPSETPFKVLYPGLDLTNFKPLTADPIFRQKITHQSSARLIVYPGGSNLTNAAELRTLYKAVALLNQRGIPVKLVRTGPPTPWFTASLGSDEKQHAFELGFIDRDQIPKLLALADVLVQPGCCGPFNDYRLPSKIPEFLASGRPVILPATNIALSMRDGHEALFLHDGSPEEIANSCVRIFNNPVLATQLGTNGRTFAKTHFDIEKNGKCLESLYQEVLSRPAAANWSILKKKGAEECDLFPLASGRATPHDIRTLAHRRRTAWSHRLRQICTFN